MQLIANNLREEFPLPLSLPNLLAWYDGSDRNTITTSGDDITTWADKSGNGYDLTNSAGASAPHSTASVGIGPFGYCPEFDGTDDFLDRTDALGLTGNPDFFFWAVVNQRTLGTTERLFHIGKTTETNGGQMIGFQPNDMSWRFNDGNRIYNEQPGGEPAIIFGQRVGGTDYGSSLGWIGNVETTQSSSTNPTNTPNLTNTGLFVGKSLGGNGATEYFSDMIVGELGFCNAELSTGQRNDLYYYLSNKWNLAGGNPDDLKAWYASDRDVYSDDNSPISIATNNQNVTEWRDLSGNGNHLTQSLDSPLGTKPVFKENAWNNLPGIEFNGSTSYITKHTGLTGIGSSVPYTIYVVAKPNDLTGQHSAVWIGDDSDNDIYLDVGFVGQVAGDPVYCDARSNTSANRAETSQGYITTEPTLITGLYTSTTDRKCWINGKGLASNTTSITLTGVDKITLGRLDDTTPGSHLDGQIYEVRVYNVAHGDSTRRTIERELALKWGLTSKINVLEQRLVAHYDANQEVYSDDNSPIALATSTQAVSEWKDLSGEGHHVTQSTAASKPLFQINQQNGMPGIEFQGTDDYLKVLSAPVDVDPISMYVVAKMDTTVNGTHALLSIQDDGNDTRYWLMYLALDQDSPPNPSPLVISKRNGSVFSAATTTGISTNTAYVATAQFLNSTSRTVHLNGYSSTTITDSVTDPTAMDSMDIGRHGRLTDQYYYDGYIFEILVYNTYHNTDERRQIEGYLESKWGVSARPENTILNGMIASWSFDETSGNITDETGNGYDLTETGTPPSRAGILGNCREFVQDSSETFTITNDVFNQSETGGTGAFTISTWAWTDNLSQSSFPGFIAMRPSSSTRVWWINWGDTAKGYLAGVSSDGSATASNSNVGAGSVVANTWDLITIAWDGTTINYYFNDTLYQSSSFTGNLYTGGSNKLVFGHREDGSTGWNGRMDHTYFWNRQINQAEVSYLYNEGNGRSFAELGGI